MIDAFKTNGSSPPSYNLDALPTRLREKIRVNAESGCWEWTACRDHDGYGRVWWNGQMRRTHRVVYQLLVGPILEETLDHLCRVRRCVNPEHLEPVSQRVNTLRGETITAMHAAKTECPYGHPYDEENAPVDLRGWRICRACKRKQNRARRARLQAAHPSPEGVLV